MKVLGTGAFPWYGVVVLLLGRVGSAAGADKIDFNRDIRPILTVKCYACHGPDETKVKGDLRLDSAEAAYRKNDEDRTALVPGKPEESEVVRRIFTTKASKIMPPPKSHKALTDNEKQLIKQWIAEGAHYKTHWAFNPPVKPQLPTIKNKTWPRNPIDAFILARLEKENLEPSAAASKTTLLRRVTLDLTGLPPTLAEVDAFLADTSPQAYEKVVDRLLQSPRYGEHMARYWLDAARYGDTHGLHLDAYREMWPYRDWVVRAFNNNMPFNQFIIEQLAGDLLPKATTDQLAATGFLRCHVTTSEGGTIEEEAYVRNVGDRIDTNGVVFLGLTLNCARCHDHKYDPVAMKDYYQIFAFFNNLDGGPMDGNAPRHAPWIKVGPPEQLAKLNALQQQVGTLQKKLADELAKLTADQTIEAEEKAWAAKERKKSSAPKEIVAIIKQDPAKRNDAQKKQLREHFLTRVFAKTQPTFTSLQADLEKAIKARDQLDGQIPTTLVFRERSDPRPSYILKRGEYDKRQDKVGRAVPAFLPPMPKDLPLNRLGFAQWLTAPNHPLTGRVAVNRFWQQIFGTGIVKTSEDFGNQGEPPSHPELLDWLTTQFVADGWNVKETLKRIVTSATYRQASRLTKDRLARDPDNRLLSRGARHRLDAEIVRDQALAVSGLLVDKIGGPGVKPPQPAGLWEAVAYPSSNTARFTADTEHEKVHRRSLYTFLKRTAPPPQMAALDAPNRESCLVRRERTNTPLQALLLMNETQFIEAARHMAERALKQGGTAEDRVRFLFRLATARTPEASEMHELLAVYKDHLAEYTRDAKAAQQLISIGTIRPATTMNASEWAAWTMVANLILNLDEVVTKG